MANTKQLAYSSGLEYDYYCEDICMSDADHITSGAKEIASLLDKGNRDECEERLLSDMLNMKPGEFKKLVEQINQFDNKNVGVDLELTFQEKNLQLALKESNVPAKLIAEGYGGGSRAWRFVGGEPYQRLFNGENSDPYKAKVSEQKQGRAEATVKPDVSENLKSTRVNFSALSQEQLAVPVEVELHYTLDPNKEMALRLAAGPNYNESLIAPICRKIAQEVVAANNYEKLRNEKTATNSDTQKHVSDELAKYGIEVRDLIVNVGINAGAELAIRHREIAIAEAKALQAQIERQKAMQKQK